MLYQFWTILLLGASITIVSAAVYPPAGTHVTSYAQINVAPNPIGVGQTVTVNMYLAVPLETSEVPKNMTLYITDPVETNKHLVHSQATQPAAHTIHSFQTNSATTQSTGTIRDRHLQGRQDHQLGRFNH